MLRSEKLNGELQNAFRFAEWEVHTEFADGFVSHVARVPDERKMFKIFKRFEK